MVRGAYSCANGLACVRPIVIPQSEDRRPTLVTQLPRDVPFRYTLSSRTSHPWRPGCRNGSEWMVGVVPVLSQKHVLMPFCCLIPIGHFTSSTPMGLCMSRVRVSAFSVSPKFRQPIVINPHATPQANWTGGLFRLVTAFQTPTGRPRGP